MVRRLDLMYLPGLMKYKGDLSNRNLLITLRSVLRIPIVLYLPCGRMLYSDLGLRSFRQSHLLHHRLVRVEVLARVLVLAVLEGKMVVQLVILSSNDQNEIKEKLMDE